MVLATPLAAFLVIVVGTYFLDMARLDGRVVPGVAVGGTDVGGMSASQARRALSAAATELETTPQPLRVAGATVELAPGNVGFDVDESAALDAALWVGRHGDPASRLAGWARARLDSFDMAWQTSLSDQGAKAFLDSIEFQGRMPAVEPVVTFEGTEPVIGPAEAGLTIASKPAIARVRRVLSSLPRRPAELPVEVIQPLYTAADAEAAAREVLDRWLNEPLVVNLGSESAKLAPEEIAAMLVSVASPDAFEFRPDPEKIASVLRPKFTTSIVAPVDARFEIRDDVIDVIPSTEGVGCCAADSPQRLLKALAQRGELRVANLEIGVIRPARTTEDLQALGIAEKLSEFTTNYKSGQSRVQNIHKIADIMRGVIVMPGETFSVNTFVGPRTRAAGWVEAGVIEEGSFTTSPGGGISQFATTLYNALYFAGLQIDEHQPHSIYISRYPKGREATFGYPKPDLVFTNTLPNAVVVWPTYTETSIAVALYGRNDGRTVESIGPETHRHGSCQVVTDTRVIRWPDGREERETQTTTYRPEGGSC